MRQFCFIDACNLHPSLAFSKKNVIFASSIQTQMDRRLAHNE